MVLILTFETPSSCLALADFLLIKLVVTCIITPIAYFILIDDKA